MLEEGVKSGNTSLLAIPFQICPFLKDGTLSNVIKFVLFGSPHTIRVVRTNLDFLSNVGPKEITTNSCVLTAQPMLCQTLSNQIKMMMRREGAPRRKSLRKRLRNPLPSLLYLRSLMRTATASNKLKRHLI